MANVFTCYVTILDDDGDKSTCQFHMPRTFTWDEVVDTAEDITMLIDAMSLGQVVACGVTAAIDPASIILKGQPVAQCDVQQCGLFTFETAEHYKHSIRIPAFDPDQFLDNSKEIDQEQIDVAAFITAIVDGVLQGETTVTPSDYRGEDITALVTAVESFRK
jgi:hypothetical protein